MKLLDIIRLLNGAKKNLFTAEELKKILRIEKENTLYKTLERLSKNRLIVRLCKGRYIYDGQKGTNEFEIANFLHCPSYVSLESALNFYGILIQAPYEITSVSPLRTKKIVSLGKEYTYTHISKRLFFDYVKEKSFLIASREKALFDMIYLVSKGLRRLDFKELYLKEINVDRIFSIVKRAPYKPVLDISKRIFK